MLFKRDSRHHTDVALVADVCHWLSGFHKLGPAGFVNDWKMNIRARSRLLFKEFLCGLPEEGLELVPFLFPVTAHKGPEAYECFGSAA